MRLRPHAKTHKCPVIALQQIALGAVGVCVQKVGEAEAMVYGGVPDVLVTNEVVGRQKLRRLMALAHVAQIGVCADDAGQVEALDAAAAEAGVTMPVYVEVNMGGNRCGVEPGEPALDLARRVADKPHLSFAGLQAYHGSAQHLRGWEERRKAIALAADKAGLTRDLLNGTAFRARRYRRRHRQLRIRDRERCLHRAAMRLLRLHGRRLRPQSRSATACRPRRSNPALCLGDGHEPPGEERAIVDAGLKALAFDSGPPVVWDEPAATYERASDEHGRLAVSGATNRLQIGDKIRLVPGHCDPTVNLYDWYVGIRNHRVEAIWPITASGAVY